MKDSIRVVVDGRSVRVAPGSMLLAAVGRVSRKFSALCTQPIPCLNECSGLCVVEVEGDPKLRRACSHQVDQPLSCETYTRSLRRERRRILAALISKRQRRCPRCKSRRTCALLALAREYDVLPTVPQIAKRRTKGAN
jgi:NADP-reducing hydrogenase subunit HndD